MSQGQVLWLQRFTVFHPRLQKIDTRSREGNVWIYLPAAHTHPCMRYSHNLPSSPSSLTHEASYSLSAHMPADATVDTCKIATRYCTKVPQPLFSTLLAVSTPTLEMLLHRRTIIAQARYSHMMSTNTPYHVSYEEKIYESGGPKSTLLI